MEEKVDELFRVPKLTADDTVFLLLHGNAKASMYIYIYLFIYYFINCKYE